MEELRKMARAFLEVQANSSEVRFFLHQRHPVPNHGVEFPFQNVGHALCPRRSSGWTIATSQRSYSFRHHDLHLSTLSIPFWRPRGCSIGLTSLSKAVKETLHGRAKLYIPLAGIPKCRVADRLTVGTHPCDFQGCGF